MASLRELDLRENPIIKIPKYRDQVIMLSSQSLSTLKYYAFKNLHHFFLFRFFR